MIESLLLLLCIPVMAFMDRARGSHEIDIPKPIALFTMGLCVSLLIVPNHGSLTAALVILGVMFGWNVWGWGQPIGYACTGFADGEPEFWQIGNMWRHPYLSLAFYGVLVGFTLWLVMLAAMLITWAFGLKPYKPDHVAIAKLSAVCVIGFPAAPFIARRVLGKHGSAAWAAQEVIRGGIIAMLLWSMVAIPVAKAHDRDDDHGATTQHVKLKGHNDRWHIPVVGFAVGAGVWCWFKCERTEEAPPPPPVDDKPLADPEVFTVRPMK